MFSCKDLEGYICNSSSSLELKFVRKEADVFDDNLAFSPQFTHQLFGEKETIFGYKNLKIKLYYTPDHLHTYLGLSYDDKVDPVKHDGTKPDNVIKALAQCLPEGFTTNLDEFIGQLSHPTTFKPFGELQHVYNSAGRTFEIYKADMSYPGFREYHARLETFLLWFIDAASFIDSDDERWSHYLVFEKHTENGQHLFSIVGYTTIYAFYAYPNRIRPRISQMLILPPFQRQGHGAQLLQSVYNDLTPDPRVLNITVEDPSDEFQALRDFVDCKNALAIECFRTPAVHEDFGGELERVCREKLKLHKKQARRVYEILRLRVTDRSNLEQYTHYRLAIKNRLNGPYQREQRDLRKLMHVMDPAELVQTQHSVSHDDHLTDLHQQYLEVEGEYSSIIEKLASTLPT